MEKKADLKSMTWKKRIGFIWDYYKWFIIIGIILIIALISTVKHFMTEKSSVAELILVNTESNSTSIVPDFSDFMEQYGYNADKEEIGVNDSYFLNITSNDSSNLYTYQSLMTILAGGGVDVFCSDELLYENLAGSSTFADLSQYLSEEELAELEDDIYYITDEETGKTYPGGIELGKDSWVVEQTYYKKGCIMGIVNGSEKEEAAGRLFRYILTH